MDVGCMILMMTIVRTQSSLSYDNNTRIKYIKHWLLLL
jgi:hypothetical protein